MTLCGCIGSSIARPSKCEGEAAAAFLKQSLFFWQMAFKAVVSTLDAATAMPYSLNQPSIFNKDFFSQTILTRNTLPGVFDRCGYVVPKKSYLLLV